MANGVRKSVKSRARNVEKACRKAREFDKALPAIFGWFLLPEMGPTKFRDS